MSGTIESDVSTHSRLKAAVDKTVSSRPFF